MFHVGVVICIHSANASGSRVSPTLVAASALRRGKDAGLNFPTIVFILIVIFFVFKYRVRCPLNMVTCKMWREFAAGGVNILAQASCHHIINTSIVIWSIIGCPCAPTSFLLVRAAGIFRAQLSLFAGVLGASLCINVYISRSDFSRCCDRH